MGGPGSPAGNATFWDTVAIQSDLDNPIVYLLAKDGDIILEWIKEDINITKIRDQEKDQAFLDDLDEDEEYLAVYDQRSQSKLEAALGIGTTVLVCIVLASGSMFFSKISNELVINPIETMLKRVVQIGKDPLKAAHDEEEREYLIELAAKEQKRLRKLNSIDQDLLEQQQLKKHDALYKGNDQPLETVIIEGALSKIGGLLAIGFGEAGSKIIAENLSKGDEINPMLDGQKMICIFGFSDIRNFTDCTEVLEEGVMLFVNEIGEIVHNIIDQYSGAANKNIGDAFLLVWKFHNED